MLHWLDDCNPLTEERFLVSEIRIPSHICQNTIVNEQNLEIICYSNIYLIKIYVSSLFGVTVITNLRSNGPPYKTTSVLCHDNVPAC